MIYGVSPNGKACGFGSHIAGSNPATLVWHKCQHDIFHVLLRPTRGSLLRTVTRSGGLWVFLR